jgi:predicted GTPase
MREKDNNERQNIVIDENDDENLAVLVVGKMGAGKSSFCRMMAAED